VIAFAASSSCCAFSFSFCISSGVFSLNWPSLFLSLKALTESIGEDFHTINKAFQGVDVTGDMAPQTMTILSKSTDRKRGKLVSLRSRRLEEVGTRNHGHTRGRYKKGEGVLA